MNNKTAFFIWWMGAFIYIQARNDEKNKHAILIWLHWKNIFFFQKTFSEFFCVRLENNYR